MNKILFVLLFSLGFTSSFFAQNSEKVKGNRDVTIEQTYLDDFTKIIVGGDFSIEIIYNSKSSVEIETDSNLHDIIKVEVVDSTLTFSTTQEISSKKRLNITVNYSTPLEYIETKDDAEIRSLTSLELNDIVLKTTGTSKAYLNINANNFEYTSLDKAKVKLNLTAKGTSTVVLSDNSKLDALVNSKEAKIDLYQRATINIEGDTNNAIIRTDNNSDFNGKNFTTKTCTLISEVASDAHVNVSEAITLEITGSSEVFLYNNPKVTINKFIDTAKLLKKETN